MYLKIIILALAACVDSRPQLRYPYEPTLIETQQTYVPNFGETVIERIIIVQPQQNTQFISAERRGTPLNVNTRRSEAIQQHTQITPNVQTNVPNQEYERGNLHNTTIKTNLNNQKPSKISNRNQQNNQPVKTNMPQINHTTHKPIQDPYLNRTRQNSEITNMHKEMQQNNYTNLKHNAGSNKRHNTTRTNVINKETNGVRNEHTPVFNENNKNIQKHTDNSNRTEYRSNVNNTDQNTRPVNANRDAHNTRSDNSRLDSKPLLNAQPTALQRPEERAGDDNMGEDEDRWIWGSMEATTPDLDNRANFDGSSCPTGKVKVGTICVDVD